MLVAFLGLSLGEVIIRYFDVSHAHPPNLVVLPFLLLGLYSPQFRSGFSSVSSGINAVIVWECC